MHTVHRTDVPVHQFYRLAISPENLPESLKSRTAIAQLTGPKTFTCLGGTWEGNMLVARTRNFGEFCIRVDTVKPVIEPANFSNREELKSLRSFRIRIRDDFSGIRSYRGEIDGKWILLEYDQKNSLVEYVYDATRVKQGITHKMVITVTDQLGNSNSRSWSFNR